MSLEEMLEAIIRKVVREELQQNGITTDRLLTAEQVAETLGYTDVNSVYNLRREGILAAVRLGKNTLRFRHSDVQRLIKNRSA
jgi:predicted DNA-binding transcriptional regulator AlpA